MSKVSLLLLLLLSAPAQAGAPRFAPTPEGEMAVDLELDLSKLPAFKWASDPFLRTSGTRVRPSLMAEEEYKLQATTTEGEDPVAVVNDRVVRIGDRVGRRTVLKIGPDFVLLGEKGSVIEAVLEEPKPGETSRAPASAASGASAPTAEKAITGNVRQGSATDAINNLMDGKISIEEVKK